MPRPKNNVLRKLFKRNSLNEIICHYGNCAGRTLSQHAGNLERHLRTVHREIYKKYIHEKSITNLNVKRGNDRLLKEVNRVNIETAIVELFTKSGKPLCLTEEHAFKILVQPVCNALNIKLNEDNVIQMILMYSNEIKARITEELRGRLVSLKIDAATLQNVSVLGISVQYVKNNNIVIQTLIIKELKRQHSGDYLKSVILDVLNDYQIDINQILTVTTDNGANMINAAIPDFNEDLKNSPEEDNIENLTESSLKLIETSFFSDMITNIESVSPHTLHLSVKDVLKIEKIKQKIEQCRSVVKKLNNKKYLNLLKNCGYKRPVLDCANSWTSTYSMLKSLSELKEIVTSLIMDNTDFLISDEDWNFIAEFLKTLNGVKSATIKLQSEKLYFTDLYVLIMDIILQTESLPRNETQAYLLEVLNKRKSTLFDNEFFNAAVFLDPRIKVILKPDQISRAKSFIWQLHARIASLKESTSKSEEQVLKQDIYEPITSSQACSTPKTLDDFLCNLDHTTINAEPIKLLTSCLETELLMYERQQRLPLNENVMEFWSCKNNSLSGIAQIILAIPCTQVSMERLFSALKYILSDQRNKLRSMNLEHILFVRANGVFNYDV